jgi:hypothetical protein
MTELCPICLEKQADSVTECNHMYCVNCLCRVKKCPMCRKELNKAKLCIEIRKVSNQLSDIYSVMPDESSFVAREETNSIPPFNWDITWGIHGGDDWD